ncbi:MULTISPECIES: arsenite efflux transporter metallochaperone ArsD [Mammaliicoccus]|uniref:arsenite efflux transporter metallochaperone ArsD n=1 Tax=Mammaliicoccus TaxID=2803850 RepID=UPI0007D968EE|nr:MULTISPECIES: arsenite efflux transporter metallochaperone ArsD [Mammaliicoccus]HDE7953483.1 arsenite efflux transporter metallochaperone ArsD [Staphylococcus aureus]OAO24868.1 transcriptional regulator [Mammaliicoccus lentus]OCA11508.1 transcriptional regulator [Mammaliicoccus sciuri]WHI54841.1 arsenite efflux transporter metallochaperone ArsD [Mammaliicoccus lentus]WHI57364.1 arsenite efflux transporter metallochaperone ArsD [Mammaliicoccus lentus]
MLNIEIYEEAMCCSTGVCGTEPDETLIKTNQINEYLKQNQIEVQRYNMNNNPNEFIKNKEVIRLIQEKGNEVLPITFIEGNIAKTGAYITQEEADEIITVNQMRNGGCCGGDGCC